MPGRSIAVLGAGLMGRLMAWRRAQKGDSVTLIDKCARDGRASAGLTAAAMIAPCTESVLREKLVRDIGLCSVNIWPVIIGELEAVWGESIHCNFNGTLVVAHGADEDDWNGFNFMAHSKLGNDDFEQVGRAGIARLEPELADRFTRGSYFKHEGVLSNDRLFASLSSALDNPNVRWIEHCEVRSCSDIDSAGSFDWILDCRGMGAAVTKSAVWPIDQSDLRGVRGEVIRVKAPEVRINRPIRLIHPRYPLYIAPHGDNHYVIGATEIESEAMHNVTVRSGLELLSALFSVHSGFAEAEILSMQANLRPAYPDNMPRIRVFGRMISINGLYRHGYLFAPALVEDVGHFMDENAGRIKFNQLFDFIDKGELHENFG